MDNNKNINRNPISTNPETTMTMDELKEEFFKSARMCEACPHWLSCSSYPTVAAIAAFLQERDEEEAEDENEEDPLLRAVYEDDEEEESCEDTDDEAEYEIPAIPPHLRPVRELDDLDAAVDDLVDSLFAVEDKIANARQFIDRLDSRVTWMLDMLEQLDIPQLSEE